MQGASPLASPGLNPRFAAKPTEFLYLEQCRQPRRGGTGGDGTIRRTRRRRLRWSSPPGQIEQVPRGACFLCRLPTLPLVYFSAPYPPARARRALFPAGEGGDQGYFMQGASPLASPGLNPGGTGAGGANRALAGGLPSLLPAYPAFSLFFCPLSPPSPLPRWGRGRFFVFLCKGLRPLHPRG